MIDRPVVRLAFHTPLSPRLKTGIEESFQNESRQTAYGKALEGLFPKTSLCSLGNTLYWLSEKLSPLIKGPSH